MKHSRYDHTETHAKIADQFNAGIAELDRLLATTKGELAALESHGYGPSA